MRILVNCGVLYIPRNCNINHSQFPASQKCIQVSIKKKKKKKRKKKKKKKEINKNCFKQVIFEQTM
jgi:hypothetical protein